MLTLVFQLLQNDPPAGMAFYPKLTVIGTTQIAAQTRKPSFKSNLPVTTDERPIQHMNSYEYHLTEPLEEQPSQRKGYLWPIKRIMLDKLYINSASKEANLAYIHRNYVWCLSQIGKEIWMADDNKDKSVTTTEKWAECRRLAIKSLDDETKGNPSSLEAIATRMIEMMRAADRIKTTIPEPKKKKPYVCKGPSRPLVRAKNGWKRVRREWAAEEDELIFKGVEEGLSCAQIAGTLRIRTPRDVFAHLKHINKLRRIRGDAPLVIPSISKSTHHSNTSTKTSSNSSRDTSGPMDGLSSGKEVSHSDEETDVWVADMDDETDGTETHLDLEFESEEDRE